MLDGDYTSRDHECGIYKVLVLVESNFKMVANRGEAIMQFWLRPGDDTVKLIFSSDATDSTSNYLESIF